MVYQRISFRGRSQSIHVRSYRDTSSRSGRRCCVAATLPAPTARLVHTRFRPECAPKAAVASAAFGFATSRSSATAVPISLATTSVPVRRSLQLGVLGSCLTHIFLIQAADRQVPLDSLEVEVSGQQDGRAGKPGFEHIPVYPHNIHYTVHVTSSAPDAELAELHAAVERVCPILNLLVNPQQISGSIAHTLPESAAVAVA